MPDVYAKHAASLAALENYFGQACPQFTWNGNPYPTMQSSARRSKKLGEGGWAFTEDLILVVRTAVFGSIATIPLEKQTLTDQNGRLYRIDQVVITPNQDFIKLVCTAATAGV